MRGQRRERAKAALREQSGTTSCGVCGGRWERPTMQEAIRAFEEHDCPAGRAARARREERFREEHWETACEACGWIVVTEKYRSAQLLAEHREVCPARADD
jgi:hypothetical protein